MGLWVLLPLSFALVGSMGVWTVCAVGVINGDVNLTYGVPLISYCASRRPQSCIFSQTFNFIAVLALMIVAIRFKLVKDYGFHGKANVVSVFLGSFSPIGLSVTSNFQAPGLIHFFGAFVAFLSGLAYHWVQVYITYRAQPYKDRIWLGPMRVFGCTVVTIMLAGMAMTSTDHGRAVCEWILVMMLFCLYGLFATEFRRIRRCYFIIDMPTSKDDCCRPASGLINHHAVNSC